MLTELEGHKVIKVEKIIHTQTVEWQATTENQDISFNGAMEGQFKKFARCGEQKISETNNILILYE